MLRRQSVNQVLQRLIFTVFEPLIEFSNIICSVIKMLNESLCPEFHGCKLHFTKTRQSFTKTYENFFSPSFPNL